VAAQHPCPVSMGVSDNCQPGRQQDTVTALSDSLPTRLQQQPAEAGAMQVSCMLADRQAHPAMRYGSPKHMSLCNMLACLLAPEPGCQVV
jgi:hypothetical protein